MTKKHTQNFVLHNSLTNFHASTVTTNAHGNEEPNCFEIVNEAVQYVIYEFQSCGGILSTCTIKFYKITAYHVFQSSTEILGLENKNYSCSERSLISHLFYSKC